MIPYDWTSKWAVYYPEKIAIKEFETGRTLTYRQLNNIANYLSNYFLNELELKTGDRIVILAENSLEHIVLFSVAQKTGLILVPLNYRLASREIDYQLNDSKPQLIIYEEKYFNSISELKSFQVIRNKIDFNSFISLNEKEKNHEHLFKSIENFDENHPLFILYTSGTTGVPKGALYTHKMLFWNSINTALRLDITSNDRSVSCTPMFHTGGWNVIPTPFLHHGAYVCLMKKFDPEIVLKLLEEEKATMFMAVPTMLSMMAQSSYFEKVDLSSVKYFIIGGEPMPLPLIEIWHKKGVPIRQGYGLTEVGPSVTSLHQDDAVRKIGSIGKINFYLKYKIVDDNGEEVKQGEVGEFILKGPSVTPGYWNNPEATKESLKDGWFYTGDLVREDDEGFLYVVDRKKNMFISGGENVYPAEIEKFLYTHPLIQEVAVIGVPDEKWGEVGKAFIKLKEGASISSEELRKYCEGNLARYKIPKYFEMIDEIPKSETGKIDRKTLLQIHLKSINKQK
ncbi:MAG: long-chain fatty acid--CoA ligase [Ignavibacteria bacterium]|jgi:fatty-acyl-CoA synthase|nr:long-chain fatty acid--CoA ligase [Ignavibacteria bacterium]MDH7528615.1 long-chain fatty acid--CoA ligase [Ignavibacteria bacterium]